VPVIIGTWTAYNLLEQQDKTMNKLKYIASLGGLFALITMSTSCSTSNTNHYQDKKLSAPLQKIATLEVPAEMCEENVFLHYSDDGKQVLLWSEKCAYILQNGHAPQRIALQPNALLSKIERKVFVGNQMTFYMYLHSATHQLPPAFNGLKKHLIASNKLLVNNMRAIDDQKNVFAASVQAIHNDRLVFRLDELSYVNKNNLSVRIIPDILNLGSSYPISYNQSGNCLVLPTAALPFRDSPPSHGGQIVINNRRVFNFNVQQFGEPDIKMPMAFSCSSATGKWAFAMMHDDAFSITPAYRPERELLVLMKIQGSRPEIVWKQQNKRYIGGFDVCRVAFCEALAVKIVVHFRLCF